jgi:hypothetical protein
VAASTVIKNFTDGSMTIKDGTGTPLTFTVPFEQGNFSITGLARKLRNVSAYESRGKFKTARHTTRLYPTWTCNVYMADFTATGGVSLGDVLFKQGATWSAAVSTFGANAQVYALDVVFTVEGTDFGDAADSTFTLEDNYIVADFSEGDPNNFALSGTCYGAITGGIAAAE